MGEYFSSREAAVNSECILSIAGMTFAIHGVSLENSSVTVLNIYKDVRSYTGKIYIYIKTNLKTIL